MEPISLGMQLANRITSDPGFNEQNVEDPRTRIAILDLTGTMQKGWMVYLAGSTETRHGGMHPPQIHLDQFLYTTCPQRLQNPDSHPRD